MIKTAIKVITESYSAGLISLVMAAH